MLLRVLYADDEEISIEGVQAIFEKSQDEVKLVAVVRDEFTLLKVLSEVKPDVVVTEVNLKRHPDMSIQRSFTIESITRWIRSEAPGTLLLVFTHFENSVLIDYLLRIGVDGVISKHETGNRLPSIILEAYHKRDSLVLAPTPGLLSKNSVIDSFQYSPLTDAEMTVLTYMALHPGDSIKEIGAALDLAVGTVNFHLASIYRRLGTNNRSEAVINALRSGILPPSLVLDLPDFLRSAEPDED